MVSFPISGFKKKIEGRVLGVDERLVAGDSMYYSDGSFYVVKTQEELGAFDISYVGYTVEEMLTMFSVVRCITRPDITSSHPLFVDGVVTENDERGSW